MPRQCCFLCATDEGVFLDITTENKQLYRKQFETCSLVKVPTSDQLPTKLCHKCVYELNQCSNFIERVKRTTRAKSRNQKPCCTLCHYSSRSELIFDFNKDHSLHNNSFDRVQTIFNYDLKSFKAAYKYICLSCRYTLDVLLDLKNVSKEISTKINDIINEKIDYVNMPKIKTNVVSRKTTTTESARTNLSAEKPALEKSDNESTKVMRTRARNNKLNNNQSNEKLQSRVCDECHSSVKAGDNLYKVHKTRNNICKKCWVRRGLDKDETENQIQQNGTETKVCKVFLKDVLKETELKEQKRKTVNKRHVTVKSIENESKSSKVVDTRGSESKQGQKRSISTVEDEEKSAKDEVPQTKKSRANVQLDHDDSKKSEESIQKEPETKRVRSSTRIVRQNSESDSSLVKRRSERSLTKQKQAAGASLSDADVDTKRNRKKLRSILEGNAVIKNLDLTDESSSNEDSAKRKRRHTSTSPDPPSKRSKTVSIRESKSPVTKSKTSQESQSSESDTNDVLFHTRTYVCDECGASYENKLLGLTHKLTHYSRPKLKLEKMKEDAIKKDTSTKTDEPPKDQSEIAISVDDDEEESANDADNAVESTEDKAQDSKKDAVEDAIDMELVMKESDDDVTEKKAEESQREEEEVDTAVPDSPKEKETETKKQKRSSYDNNNKSNNNDESEEKESPDSKGKKKTSLSSVEETKEKEDKQNALLSDNEDVAEEKENVEEEQKPEESNVVNNKDDEKEDEDAGDKTTRTERKDSSEEEPISLGIWEPEAEVTESINESESPKSSKNEVTKDKLESSKTEKAESSKDDKEEEEKEAEETVIDVESSGQESSECVEIKESGDDDIEQIGKLKKTITKSIISEEIIVTKESITIEEDDIEIESESISNTTVTKAEESTDCADAAAEVLREVIDLASAEVQKRQEVTELDSEEDSNEVETLENISREIQNSVEVPPLD
nr:PREDICTED: myb-like protein X [Megachile rotundata]